MNTRRDPSDDDGSRNYEIERSSGRRGIDSEGYHTGNSLDYYNEDLSRKAVGRLFDEDEGVPAGHSRRDEPDDGFVKGFSDGSPRQQRSSRPERGAESAGDYRREYKNENKGDYRNEGRPPRASSGGEKPYNEYDREYEGRHDKSSDRTALDEDGDATAYRRKPRGEDTPQPTPAVRINQNRGASAVGRTGDPHPVGHNPGRVMSSGEAAYTASSRREGAKDSSGEDYSQYRKRGDEREVYTASRKPQQLRTTGGGAVAASKKAVGQEDYDQYGGGDYENSGMIKIIFGATAVVFLIILACLIFTVNSLNGKLKTANAALENVTDQQTVNAMTIENEDLRSRVAALEGEREELTGKLAMAEAANGAPATAPPSDVPPPDDGQGGTPATQAPTETVTQPPSGASQTYTVVAGDSLGKIAKKFYGSDSQTNIDKIAKANNIADPSLISIGQKLQIP